MIVALASPRVAASIDDGLRRIERLMAQAAEQRAEIICFPEAYMPGLRGLDFEVPPFDRIDEERVVQSVAAWARTHAIATILGMEHVSEAGRQIVAVVFDAGGRTLGVQTKNQLDPSEEPPRSPRRLMRLGGRAVAV